MIGRVTRDARRRRGRGKGRENVASSGRRGSETKNGGEGEEKGAGRMRERRARDREGRERLEPARRAVRRGVSNEGRVAGDARRRMCSFSPRGGNDISRENARERTAPKTRDETEFETALSRLPFRDCLFETTLSRLSRVSSAQFRRGVVTYFHTKVSYFTSPERGASFIRRERPILRPPLPPRRRRRRGGSR